MHCYSGRLPLAVELMKQGFMISFAGPLTFSNAKKSVEVAARVPLDRILVETDCPYLTPERTGQEKQPCMFGRWPKLAEIHRKSLQEIAYIIANNTAGFWDCSRQVPKIYA